MCEIHNFRCSKPKCGKRWREYRKLASCDSMEDGINCPDEYCMFAGRPDKPNWAECKLCRRLRELDEDMDPDTAMNREQVIDNNTTGRYHEGAVIVEIDKDTESKLVPPGTSIVEYSGCEMEESVARALEEHRRRHQKKIRSLLPPAPISQPNILSSSAQTGPPPYGIVSSQLGTSSENSNTCGYSYPSWMKISGKSLCPVIQNAGNRISKPAQRQRRSFDDQTQKVGMVDVISPLLKNIED